MLKNAVKMQKFCSFQFEKRFNAIGVFETLSSKDNSFWMQMLRQWTAQPWATVRGKSELNKSGSATNTSKESS